MPNDFKYLETDFISLAANRGAIAPTPQQNSTIVFRMPKVSRKRNGLLQQKFCVKLLFRTNILGSLKVLRKSHKNSTNLQVFD